MKPLVIYHAHCTDGFGAAFAAWMKLGDDAEYLPMSYEQSFEVVDADVNGRDVYIIDFSFPRETMDALLATAGHVVWLDHHKTAFEMWTGGSMARHEELHDAGHYLLLDNDKSGAMLAWEYFHPGFNVPHLIQRIDDRDRWVFQYDDSKALHAGLAAMQPWTFERWLPLLDGGSYYNTVTRGEAILTAQDANVERMAQQAMKCKIRATTPANGPDIAEHVPPSWSDGYIRDFDGLAVNAPIHQSELGHVLAVKSGTYGLVWRLAADGAVACSIRSNGDYDVSAIAKAFGGGGHRNAAGFQTNIQTLLGWLK
jgi:oligoribonuclease NrnB/cAMP/cGMP phosphodiesterase (DHH superfamily)